MTLPRWISEGARVVATDADADAERAGTAMLERRVAAIADLLAERGYTGPVGVLAENSPDWIAVDLATHVAEATLVPLPGFFRAQQLEHAVRSSRMQALFCADARCAAALGFVREVPGPDGLRLFERAATAALPAAQDVPARPQKITFTSGSTGAPKGVSLTALRQVSTAQALARVTAPLGITRHLILLPLAVLLENVAGVYAPLALGATAVCPPLATAGFGRDGGFDAGRCLAAIEAHRAESVILLPQMLRALVAALECSREARRAVRSLRFAAVGGAKTPARLIVRANELGLPVHEGYGLSECGSVVTLNVPGADRVGSAGRALPGLRVRVAADGEIEVQAHEPPDSPGTVPAPAGPWLRTGDLGSIDAEGYLTIDGRKGDLLITGYGRNVSPEWPESLLAASPQVAQAAVFGEGRPDLVAVLVAAAPRVSHAALDAAVAQANAALPAYARIRGWLRADDAFTAGNGLATANGKLRRPEVWARYADRLNLLYETECANP